MLLLILMSGLICLKAQHFSSANIGANLVPQGEFLGDGLFGEMAYFYSFGDNEFSRFIAGAQIGYMSYYTERQSIKRNNYLGLSIGAYMPQENAFVSFKINRNWHWRDWTVALQGAISPFDINKWNFLIGGELGRHHEFYFIPKIQILWQI